MVDAMLRAGAVTGGDLARGLGDLAGAATGEREGAVRATAPAAGEHPVGRKRRVRLTVGVSFLAGARRGTVTLGGRGAATGAAAGADTRGPRRSLVAYSAG